MRCADDNESPSTSSGRDAADAMPEQPNKNNARSRPIIMSSVSQIVLSTREVSKTVDGPDGKLTILDGVSLEVVRGASLAIVGASGSGKTTLLGLLAGLDRPSAGSVSMAGQRLDELDEEARARLRRRLVGFVFQSFHLLPALNAEENVMLPLELEGRSDASARARAALAGVGLDARRHHYPHQLSGGEQQRVALARAFVHEPEVLFADEPTGNLDQRTGGAVSDLLFALNREHGTTLVLVTHDTTLASRCERSLRLADGRIVGTEYAAAGHVESSPAREAGDREAFADRAVGEGRP
jgi:putative ABC transport system ATP-binding protein